MKVHAIKHPGSGVIWALFSKYEWALNVSESLFSRYEDYQSIQEFEIDPFKEQLEQGLFPWVLTVDIKTSEAKVRQAKEWFTAEHIIYTQGPYATAYVFAATEEDAENRALDLWAEYNDEKPVKISTIWAIEINEEGEFQSVRRYGSFSSEEVNDEIFESAKGYVEARIVAEDIHEAVEKAGTLYDAWIDEQIKDEDDPE